MYKTGQILRYLGESLVFSKNKEYTVETSNEKFFIVRGHPYPHSSPFWEPSLKVGDWMWTNFRRSIQRVTHPSQEGEKVDVDSHPHRDVIRAHEQGEIVQLRAYDGTWQDTRYPGLYLSDEYRVKPTEFKVGDWVYQSPTLNGIGLVIEVSDKFLLLAGPYRLGKSTAVKVDVAAHPHRELTKAYALGAEIEVLVGGFWCPVKFPSFYINDTYRVKPNCFKVGDWVWYRGTPSLVAKVQDSNLVFKGKSIVCSAAECTLVRTHTHWDTMQEWAKGMRIEARRYHDQPWLPVRTPSWYVTQEYRVAPEPKTQLFQVYHRSKAYNIEVTFIDDKITKLTAL
jgi:hypothetical protein